MMDAAVTTPMLHVDGLEASYGDSQVLFGIDFALDSREAVTLLGRNGMGNTTTLNTIMVLLLHRASRRASPATELTPHHASAVLHSTT